MTKNKKTPLKKINPWKSKTVMYNVHILLYSIYIQWCFTYCTVHMFILYPLLYCMPGKHFYYFYFVRKIALSFATRHVQHVNSVLLNNNIVKNYREIVFLIRPKSATQRAKKSLTLEMFKLDILFFQGLKKIRL